MRSPHSRLPHLFCFVSIFLFHLFVFSRSDLPTTWYGGTQKTAYRFRLLSLVEIYGAGIQRVANLRVVVCVRVCVSKNS